MNKKLTYELTIAEKLEQVSIPDLSDIIWSRIEKELDADPGDIDPEGPSSPAGPGPGIIWGGLGLLVLAGLFYYFINRPGQPDAIIPTSQPTETPEFSAPASETNRPREQIQPPSRAPVSNTTNTPIFGDTATGKVVIQEDNNVIDLDTVTTTTNTPPPPALVIDTSAPKKKRGVQGISPDDYKIVPKKDSSE